MDRPKKIVRQLGPTTAKEEQAFYRVTGLGKCLHGNQIPKIIQQFSLRTRFHLSSLAFVTPFLRLRRASFFRVLQRPGKTG
jgi:hypothetical protein